MIRRVLESEVMDTIQDALEYDSMDFTDVNTAFAERALELIPSEGLVLDLGTGTARIPILMLEKNPKINIAAGDLSQHMLDVGKINVDKTIFKNHITLQKMDAKRLPYPDHYFDAVISNSLIHHIPDPIEVFREINRVAKLNAGILIRDLIRPESEEILESLVGKYATNCNEHQRKLFRDSLRASLTLAEVKELVRDSGLYGCIVVQSSDRHWSVEKMWSA